jgi:hypothetical protein
MVHGADAQSLRSLTWNGWRSPRLSRHTANFQSIGVWLRLLVREQQRRADQLKDFPNASFPPETIKLMKDAMEAAVETLRVPVSSGHIQSIAETILRTAKEGERDPATLRRMALLELQIRPRD